MTYNIWRVCGDGKSSWGLGKRYDWLFTPIEASSVYEAMTIASKRAVTPTKHTLLNHGDVVLVAATEGGHDQCGLFRIEIPSTQRVSEPKIETFRIDR